MGFVDSVVHAKSTRVCNLSSSSYSEARSGRKMMENDHFPSHISLPVYKQRGVSAVRDFPPGCGRFATGSSLRPDKDEAPNNTVENLEGTYKDGSIQLSETGFGTQSTCAQKSSVCVEMLGQQDTSESEFERLKSSAHPKYGLMSVDIKQMEAVDLSEGVGALDNARLFTPLEAFEQETCAIVNDFCQVDDAALDEELVPPSDLGLLPLHNDSAAYPNGNDLEKTLARSYPPRRRVSAVRDFPPNCGRNVPFLNEEKHLEVLDSSERKCLGQEKFNSEDEPLKGTMQTNVKGMGVDVGREDDQTSKLEGYKPKSVRDEVKVESEGRPSKRIGKQDKIITALENKKLKTAVRMDKSVAEGLGKDSVGFTKVKTVDQNVADLSGSENHLQDEDCEVLKFSSEMAASNSPCRLVKGSSKANVAGGIAKSTGKKHHPLLLERYKSAVKPRKVKAEKSGGTFSRRRSSSTQNAFPAMHQLVASDVKNSTRQDEVSHVSAHNIDVSLPPSWPIGLIGKSNDSDGNVTRNKVRETLRLFQALCRKLLREAEAKPADRHRRIDCQAAKILKDKNRYINTDKIIGSVPGVEVGDEFQYRVELNIIGMHRLTQGGIDYMKHGGISLAVSVVASGGYDNELDSDVLTYTGSGGNVANGSNKEHVDQKLERGNLALANSKNAQNPIRVIRGEDWAFDTSDARGRTYVYDGLYLVEDYWEQIGPHGSKVFKFRLTRIPGQPELAWKEVKQSKKLKVRNGVCVDDISQGKEPIPISAVNTIDDEKPPSFKYVTGMIYPDWYHSLPPKGCDCLNGCLEGKCSCVAKNGGEIPYNHNGAIVETKPLVYECGPSCKCPHSCYNRVSQLGIKFQLEIFKTESRGWGLRSLDFIHSGSFIGEYAGELLEENEAEKRTGMDEYLFDIGDNYNDGDLWNELSTMMHETQSTSHEVVECVGFTIDAARYGNVGRFINHSCSPNLYAQNVLYDHEDKRIPHIMMFAAENIPPLKELTYHYNYKIDQVYDSDGNVKKKSCYCGSSKCTGRMY
ncbi:histone-lysine N-methyltransferase, H3 lysine-9 specific SUVH6-like [Tripterygium wilfordii]|uniref:histone-lysine N-methyltransferase, H3 lysine-9 specific SUVH6-like n=1 Tax=Tripterygium wilfordii TaxID=458696 RepID=UPI0018F84365|nr:histone-lysine N-methyltransferase, H3 lysine-9 specific SUVH6-like [Tripterygium wilfordii]XP_038687013.1 histone-lysine N-methyltransferase, H3 lysine-9 specific SUVH6-like [Tripterygium wilfordii]XP_038687014.1 histone-lysine N-methyltransferase, H3 lysine-9 specific SUVH6-like [Tripterygium wilfordii]XP_038687015.1 histone-lysine N-methyltransferase, H3 lysine-9 specific SUVH6-like [Tripterygium wilfordii]XP_038687016.1 histone-lysine N-methyltransferase, H3 lysine-9 specific SUVH6-like 